MLVALVSSAFISFCFLLLFVYIIVEQWRRKEDYSKCQLIGEGSPSSFYCWLYTSACTYQYTLCIVAIDCTPCYPKYQNIPYFVAIVDYTQSATASFEDFFIILHENITV